jgi:hypothetical protein
MLCALSLASLVGADRAGQALFFDGAQLPFNTTDPPSPGMVYVTPRRTPPTARVGPWFEYETSFTIQFWMRPIRVFVGTDVEGGLIGCLVRETLQNGGGKKAGYGLTINSESKVAWIVTVGAETGTVTQTVVVNSWTHITAIYDASDVTMRLYYSLGLGDGSIFTGSYTFDQAPPYPVNYNIHNDLMMGKFQPLYDTEYYYSGYMDEVKFWSKALTRQQMDQSLYRTYLPDSDLLLGTGISGYWPMNSVVCTERLCENVASLQQWIHAGGSGRFTSSLVLKASPLDLSESVRGIDCRVQASNASHPSCICSEFESIYCWNAVRKVPVMCTACPTCPKIQCYGPYGAPKCLTVQGGVQTVNGRVLESMVELAACIDGSTSQKWTKYSTATGQLQVADFPTMCLATEPQGPYRGSSLHIEACVFEAGLIPARQLWMLDSTALSLKNPGSGMCLTSSAAYNGALPYLVDCVEIAPPDSLTPLQGFVFDFALLHNGALIGGVYLSDSPRCNALSQCEQTIKAPIDQAPRITHIDGAPVQSYLLRRSGTVNELIQISLTARDPNQNDLVQFDFSPYDRNLLTDSSVTWQSQYLCSGGTQPGSNCTCQITPTSTTCTTCPGEGVCIRNPANPCPANPCTRVFRWLPTLATLFSNPTTFIFTVTDIPTNEYNPLEATDPQGDQGVQVGDT